MGYAFAALLMFLALFLIITRCCGQGKPVDELKVTTPLPMNTMEQLLAVQNAISQAEELIQDGNIVLLKCRALLLSIFPQAAATIAALTKKYGAEITVVVIDEKEKESLLEHETQLASMRWHLSEGGFQKFKLLEKLEEGNKPTTIIGEVADKMNKETFSSMCKISL